MSNPPLVPTDAEQLLADLSRSVSQAANSPASAAVIFNPPPGQAPAEPSPESPPSEPQPAPAIQTPDERLRAVEDDLEAAARALGSVPPSSPTLRGRIGGLLIRMVNRIVWWPLVVGQQVTSALIRVVRVHREEQIKLHQSVNLQIAQFATVLHERNMQFQELGRTVEDLSRNHVVSRLLPRIESVAEELDAVRKQVSLLEQSMDHLPFGSSFRRDEYIPLLREAGIGSENMPLLDLAGGSEWLDVLRHEGLDGHAVEPGAEPVSYLAGLPAGSIGAVTAFDIVEHLPVNRLLALVDHGLRVLKPRGLLIFETTADFSGFMKSVLETRGVIDVRLLPLRAPHDKYAIIGVHP